MTMTSVEIKETLAQAKSLHDGVAPAPTSALTQQLQAYVASSTEYLLGHNLEWGTANFKVRPVHKNLLALPKSEIEKMIGDDILAYVTLKSVEAVKDGYEETPGVLKLTLTLK